MEIGRGGKVVRRPEPVAVPATPPVTVTPEREPEREPVPA